MTDFESISHSKPINEIIFENGEIWLLKFNRNGQIKFNRDLYPDYTPDDFTKDFMEILERTMEVKFDKKKRFEHKNFTQEE